MKLEDMKSVNVLAETPEAVTEFLLALQAKAEDHPELLRDTSVSLDDDGRGRVNKLGCGSKVVGEVPKALPAQDEWEDLAGERDVEWSGPDRVLPWRASDERVDRHGDIVRQDWSLDRFVDNPVILKAHEWYGNPVGKSIAESVEQVKETFPEKYDGPALIMLPMFATEDVSGDAEGVWRLAVAGFLSKGSVGFYPGRIIRVDDDDERGDLGLGRWGVIYENCELLEFSIVTIPSNVGAGRQRVAKSIVTPKDLDVLLSVHRGEVLAHPHRGDADEIRTYDEAMTHVWRTMYPEHQFSKVEMKMTIVAPKPEKKAILVPQFSKADDDEVIEESTDVTRADLDDLKKAVLQLDEHVTELIAEVRGAADETADRSSDDTENADSSPLRTLLQRCLDEIPEPRPTDQT